MAAARVKPIVWGDPSGVGADVDQIEIDDQAQGISVAAVMLQEPLVMQSDAVQIDRLGSELRFRDGERTTPRTLSDLLTLGSVLLTRDGTVVFSRNRTLVEAR